MSPSERSDRHRRAASYLAKVDRPRQVVASHLVNTLPREDHGVVEVLTRAAEESLDSGAPLVAAAQLLRAVGELKPADTDPQLIRLAASAHMRAGKVDEALDLWSRALSRMVTPEDQALCLADIGDARMTLGDREAARASYEEANHKLRQAGHDSSSQVMRLLVARMGRAQAIFDGGHSAVEGIIADALNQPVTQDTHADRLLFALAGSALAFEGRDAQRARELALRAEAQGGLLAQESCDGSGFYIVTGVLTWTDSFDEVLEALTAAVEESRRTGSSLGFATASYCRGYAYYRKGDLRNAVTDLDAALAMRSRGWNEYVEAALAGLAFAHLDLGQLEEARALEPELREVAKRDELISAFALAAAGRIRASDDDHERALEDYRAAGRLMGPFRNPALVDWRELSTRSLKELGRDDEARAAAKEAVTLARQWGSPRAIGVALRARAEVASSAASDRLLREAAHHFDSCGAVDQLARTRLSLGASLMRSPGTRAEGVTLVRAALDYGRQADVPPIVTDASRVLLQHGVKVAEPVGSPLHTLTPGERRVVELAATGRTNRTIAQELFVTVKAVEWHLSNAYRKLSISSRAQLPDIIAGHSGDATSAALSSSAR
jgi:tetratricopeptide (TPR) repeat protein/DNA-binding CsgD family transcriptional regulator